MLYYVTSYYVLTESKGEGEEDLECRAGEGREVRLFGGEQF
jgi:hypothetical protein